MTLANVLIRQGVFALFGILIPIFSSFFVPNYSSLSQHMSEMQVLSHWAALATRLGAGLAGMSIVLFGIGCLFISGKFRLSWTCLVSTLFGIGMVANGLFIYGHPLHGMYGLPIFSVLVAPFFAAEFRNAWKPDWFKQYSLFTGMVSLFFMWILIVGIEPQEYMGLTQRISSIFSFGWFAVAAFVFKPQPQND